MPLVQSVAALRALDPVTTELVRLRGARTHNCRLCRSLRTVSALEAGADEELYGKIDRFEHSDMEERHKVALRLTDAVITQPSGIGPELVAQVRASFSPAEVVELVTDILRNSGQKMAVALDADQANVTRGVEYYDTLPDGDTVYLHRFSEPQGA
jgi:AhpD family alkylhydroperoxidase